MKCLVTGAAGFIGSNLVKRLAFDGYKVKGLIHNSQPRLSIKNVEYIQGDITKKESIKYALEDVDIIFHCAAIVKDYGKKKQFYKVNYEGTKNLIMLCNKNNLKRFIFLSHIDYNGKNIGYYSKTKLLSEQYLIDKYKKEEFPIVIIRPGNVYGTGNSIWVQMPLNAIKKNRIALIDNGKGIFLHTYIDNLLDALILSMKKTEAVGKIIDITDGDNNTSWGEYLNLLAKMLRKSPIKRNFSNNSAMLIGKIMIFLNIFFKIKPIISPTSVQIFSNKKKISIKPAFDILGYKPSVDFESGMKQIENWLRSEENIG